LEKKQWNLIHFSVVFIQIYKNKMKKRYSRYGQMFTFKCLYFIIYLLKNLKQIIEYFCHNPKIRNKIKPKDPVASLGIHLIFSLFFVCLMFIFYNLLIEKLATNHITFLPKP